MHKLATFGRTRPFARSATTAVMLVLCDCTASIESDETHTRPTTSGSSTAASTTASSSTGPGATSSTAVGAGGDSGSTGAAGGSGAGGGGGSGGGTADSGAKDARPPDANMARDVYVADRNAGAAGILIHVENGCPFDIWIRGVGGGGTLQPDNAQLKTGENRDYIAPDQWNAARVTAYGSTPPANELDKVEMTLGNKILNYNITYVDWVGLPVEVVGIGSGADCKRVGCYVPHAEVTQGCPDGLLSGQRCVSAGSYCLNGANQSKPYCHALDGAVAQCASHAGCSPGNANTVDAYSCRSGSFFGTSPKWCAALNRGMVDDPDTSNPALYYQKAPYNSYAKWVHGMCPGIYAFPYDDYGHVNESGFHSCTGGRQLNITFCPSG